MGMDLLRIGRLLLVPASVVFSLRASLLFAGTDPGSVAGLGLATAASGALALVGIVVAWWGARKTDARDRVFVGLLAVIAGHFGLSGFVPDFGAGLVYAGTGLAAHGRLGAWAGLMALVGALVRGDHLVGHLLVALGAALLVVALLRNPRESHE